MNIYTPVRSMLDGRSVYSYRPGGIFHRSRNLIRISLIVLCMMCMLPLPASAATLGHKEQIFTADDGLPTTSMLAVEQTSDGFIWLGGYGGLSRYDGKDFSNFGGSSICNVIDLLATDDGTLWIASMDSGLIRMRGDEFYFYNDCTASEEDGSDSELYYKINCIAQASDGTIYFSTDIGVACVDENDTVRWIGDDRLRSANAWSLACDSDGGVWCINGKGEVYSCAGEVRQIDLSPEGDTIRSIAYDKQCGTYCIGTENNTVIVCDPDLKNIEYIEIDGVSSINAFGFTADDRVLVCSDDGVAVIQDGEIFPQSLKVDNSIEDVLVDIDGNIWFASSRQGVLLETQGRFQDISLIAGLDNYVVNSILHEDDRLYVGHDSGYVILDEDTYQVIEDENYAVLEGLRIREMHLDSQGRMWVSTTGDGLYMREADGKTWKNYCKETHPVIQSDKFRCVIEASAGIIAATDAGGYIINGDEVTRLAEGLDVRILSLVEANGMIYAGTDGNGLYAVKDGQIQRVITPKDGLSSLRVMKMKPCSGNRGLWLASGNNLDYLLFETGTVHHADTFPCTNVLDCLVMEDSTLWILAGNGIYQTTEEAILLDENILDYRHYSRKNGIPYDMTANSFPQVMDGYAYLCGAEGIAWMDMDQTYGIPESYLLNIDYILQDDERIYVQGADSITIPSNVKRLELEGHLATFTQENPTLFYYLEGFEKTPHFTSYQKLSNIVYTNIPGGDYTFHFGVYDPEHSTMGQEILLNISVSCEWYELISVKILLVAAGIFLVALLSWSVFWINEIRRRRETERKYNENRHRLLNHLAYTDYLTELYNRNYLSKWTAEHSDSDMFPLCIIEIDCNNLKLVNDRFGHAMGDMLLKTLSALLQRYFSRENFTLLRVGGDEFLVIAENTDREDAEKYLNAILKEAYESNVCNIPLSFCYGLSVCSSREEFNLEKMIRTADEEMITSKQLFHSQVYQDNNYSSVYIGEEGTIVERHMKNDILKNVLYEAFAEASDFVYIYALDMNTGVSRWSRNCVEFFGLPSEYIINADTTWGEHIHPDFREAYYADLRAVFEGRKQKHDLQYRALNRYNEYVWVECKGSVVRGANGKNLFAGMMTRMDNQSVYDTLTGLKTKNQFYDTIQQKEDGIAFLIGTDFFKDIINIYGYNNGDKVLIQVGRAFLKCCDRNTSVFRFNGDEFVFIIPNGTQEDVAALFARIRQQAGEICLDNNIRIRMSFSGGAAYYSHESCNTDRVVNQMELALSYVKKSQKGSYAFYSDEVLAQDNRRRLIKRELKESIDNGFKGFELYYQPLMQREGCRIIGCEALLRWKGTEVTDSTPAEFIPILEEDNAIIEVGSFVMQEAMKQQKIWSEKYGSFIMSINVSYQQFLSDGYVQEIVNAAERFRIDPRYIMIELTESCRVQSPAVLANIFTELRTHGFYIVLDDFGTGYASLEMLKKLPCDGIKIEHSFVRELSQEGHDIDFAIIRSILLLCNETKQTVIVEGVENAEVDSIVRHLSVNLLQGYYYSKPVCAKEFEKIIEQKGNRD